MKTNRQDVYRNIDIERSYQDSIWGTLDEVNSVGDFLCYMKRFLDKAMQENNPEHPFHSLDNIRKITALGVACMEAHGVVARKEN